MKSGRARVQPVEQWEGIIAKHQRVNGDLTYSIILDEMKGLGELISDYNIIRASLALLLYKVDRELVDFIKEEYNLFIDVSSSQAYEASLKQAIHISTNYETKIAIKKSQLNEELPKHGAAKIGFEELIASLTMHLDFNVPDDITLARYNEYVKLIKKQHGRRTDKEEGSN